MSELRKDSKSKYGRQLCFLAKELTFSSVLPRTQQSFEFFEYLIECAKALAILPAAIIPHLTSFIDFSY